MPRTRVITRSKTYNNSTNTGFDPQTSPRFSTGYYGDQQTNTSCTNSQFNTKTGQHADSSYNCNGYSSRFTKIKGNSGQFEVGDISKQANNVHMTTGGDSSRDGVEVDTGYNPPELPRRKRRTRSKQKPDIASAVPLPSANNQNSGLSFSNNNKQEENIIVHGDICDTDKHLDSNHSKHRSKVLSNQSKENPKQHFNFAKRIISNILNTQPFTQQSKQSIQSKGRSSAYDSTSSNVDVAVIENAEDDNNYVKQDANEDLISQNANIHENVIRQNDEIDENDNIQKVKSDKDITIQYGDIDEDNVPNAEDDNTTVTDLVEEVVPVSKRKRRPRRRKKKQPAVDDNDVDDNLPCELIVCENLDSQDHRCFKCSSCRHGTPSEGGDSGVDVSSQCSSKGCNGDSPSRSPSESSRCSPIRQLPLSEIDPENIPFYFKEPDIETYHNPFEEEVVLEEVIWGNSKDKGYGDDDQNNEDTDDDDDSDSICSWSQIETGGEEDDKHCNGDGDIICNSENVDFHDGGAIKNKGIRDNDNAKCCDLEEEEEEEEEDRCRESDDVFVEELARDDLDYGASAEDYSSLKLGDEEGYLHDPCDRLQVANNDQGHEGTASNQVDDIDGAGEKPEDEEEGEDPLVEIDYDNYLPANILMHVKRDLVSILMEYGQTREVKVSFDEMDRTGPHHASRFFTSAVVDDESFPVGCGSSKKNAKKAAAAFALKIMYERGRDKLNIVNETAFKTIGALNPKDPESRAHKILLISRHALEVCQETQFINYSKEKIVATFVLEFHGKMKVVALGTGNRCILFPNLTKDGKKIIHAHAEIIARRALIRYFYKQLLLYNRNKSHPIFTKSDSGKLKLRDKIQVHLYISRPPCGDAAAFPTIGNHPNKMRAVRKQGQLRTLIDDGEGAIPTEYHVPPGANGKERLRIMTCSDKILRWNALGVQGALLSHFIDPIYINTLVIGSHTGDQRGHLPRAISGRIRCGRLHEVIQRPFRINCPDIQYPHDDLSDIYAINKSKQYFITWSYGDEDAEVTDAITGVTNMEPMDEPVISRICKLSLHGLFLELCDKLGRTDLMSMDYGTAKRCATTFQRMKSFVGQHMAVMGFGHWYSLQETYGTDNFPSNEDNDSDDYDNNKETTQDCEDCPTSC